ncbi:MAG: hypothetical protein LPK31_07735 [Actinomycetes bacterium]|nr:hypothetical protein [Actinomycetes bacterium]
MRCRVRPRTDRLGCNGRAVAFNRGAGGGWTTGADSSSAGDDRRAGGGLGALGARPDFRMGPLPDDGAAPSILPVPDP